MCLHHATHREGIVCRCNQWDPNVSNCSTECFLLLFTFRLDNPPLSGPDDVPFGYNCYVVGHVEVD